MTKRKYNYPSIFIRKDGKLMKNKKRLIIDWRNDIKKNYLNEDIYKKLKLENNKLKIENNSLKLDIKMYENALEEWVLIAQNN